MWFGGSLLVKKGFVFAGFKGGIRSLISVKFCFVRRERYGLQDWLVQFTRLSQTASNG